MKKKLFITILIATQGFTASERHIPISRVSKIIDDLQLVSQALVPLITSYAQSEKWVIKSQEESPYTDEHYFLGPKILLKNYITSFLSANPHHGKVANYKIAHSKKYRLKNVTTDDRLEKITADIMRKTCEGVAIYDNETQKKIFHINLNRKIAKLFEEDKILFAEEEEQGGRAWYTTQRLMVKNFLKNTSSSKPEVLLQHPNRASYTYSRLQRIATFEILPSEKVIFTLTSDFDVIINKTTYTVFCWEKDIFHEVTEK